MTPSVVHHHSQPGPNRRYRRLLPTALAVVPRVPVRAEDAAQRVAST
jgi:hypothetical protein